MTVNIDTSISCCWQCELLLQCVCALLWCELFLASDKARPSEARQLVRCLLQGMKQQQQQQQQQQGPTTIDYLRRQALQSMLRCSTAFYSVYVFMCTISNLRNNHSTQQHSCLLYPRRLLSRQESGGLNLLQRNQCKHVNKKSVNRYKSHEMSAHDARADTS
jgi:hypothetical protein